MPVTQKQAQPAEDPWAAAAAQYKQSGSAAESEGQPTNDDWKMWNVDEPQAKMANEKPGFGRGLWDNTIGGIYHAFADPATPEEKATGYDAYGNVGGRGLMRMGRGLIEPTIEGVKTMREGMAEHNTPKVGVGAMSAVPIAGPMMNSFIDHMDTPEGDTNNGYLHRLRQAFSPYNLGAAGGTLAMAAGPEGIGKLARPVARAAAIGDVTRMVKPGASDVAFGKAPAVGLLEQPGGTFSMSKEGLLERSKGNMGKIGSEIGKEVARAPQIPMSVSGEVINPFYKSLQKAAKSNEGGLVTRLSDARKGLTNRLHYSPAADSIVDAGPRNLTSMTPSEVWDLKKQVGGDTRWTNQAFDEDVNATRGEVYGGLKEKLNQAVPSLRPLNEQFGNLKAGTSALERRMPIEARNSAVSLPDAILGGGAAVSGGGAPGAVAIIAGKKLIQGTPFRTGLQTGLYKFGTSMGRRTLFPAMASKAASKKDE